MEITEERVGVGSYGGWDGGIVKVKKGKGRRISEIVVSWKDIGGLNEEYGISLHKSTYLYKFIYLSVDILVYNHIS